MKKMNSFSFLKEICFTRIGGSKEELLAANKILDYLKERKVNAHLESFLVDGFKVETAKLISLDDNKEYEVTGFGNSGSTDLNGLTASFKYVESAKKENLFDCEGKIVLLDCRLTYSIYKLLIEAKVAGFIAASGSLYDELDKTDLAVNSLRPLHYNLGKIPGVTLRMKDVHELALKNPKEIKLVLIQEEYKKESHNVIATITGTECPNRIIALTAHYDSVLFSTGAYDNGTGTTTILETLEYFLANPPKRTLKFIWCGSEEMGLLGSKDYCEKHKDELNNYDLCVNVDMTGVVLGKDIAVCSAEKALPNYIEYLGKQKGFVISAKQGVYSSDSTPFADHGVPSLSFARISPNGGAEIHSRKDIPDFLDEKNYYRTCEFINEFVSNMDSSVIFPVDRNIPDNIKEEIDYYYFRKERKPETK